MLRSGRLLVLFGFVALVCVCLYVCWAWPSDDPGRFRWNWAVNLLVGVGTGGAVLVALFRENIRPWLFRYALAVDLWDARGVATPTAEGQRWFHLRVTNPHRTWLTVKGVRVVLARVDLSENGAPYEKVWEGLMPFQWAHEATLGEGRDRTLGGEARADLCLADRKSQTLQLALAHLPNELPHPYRAGQSVRVWLRAQGHEADSPTMRIEISWDGVWEDDEGEMAKRFVVRVVDRG